MTDAFERVVNELLKGADEGRIIETINVAKEAQQSIEVPKEAVEMVNFAMRDLSQRLNISPSRISIALIQKMSWPNSALGCPKPGLKYMQVISPGWLIVLSVNENRYAYHSDNKGPPFFCETSKWTKIQS